MGAVFGLIGSDVKSKIDLLYGYLVDEGRINFVTVKTMMEYETENDLLNKKGYVSGCRTLLRLNRVLNFIRELLRRVGQLEPLDNTNSACQEAYDQTLALYHPHLLQKGTRMAMLTLPTRNQLLYRVIANDDEAVQRDVAVFPVMNTIIGKVYTRVQNLYTIMDLHSLP